MAQKLLDYYKQAQDIGRVKAAMRMAMLTGISSAKAGGEPDSPDNVKRFETALAEIKKEFQ